MFAQPECGVFFTTAPPLRRFETQPGLVAPMLANRRWRCHRLAPPTHPQCLTPSDPKGSSLDGVLPLDDKRSEHMKKFLTGTLLAICLSATVARSQEDQARYQTVTLTTSSVPYNGGAAWTGTNSIEIAEGEVGEIVNYAGGRGNCGTYVIKNAKVCNILLDFDTCHIASYHKATSFSLIQL